MPNVKWYDCPFGIYAKLIFFLWAQHLSSASIFLKLFRYIASFILKKQKLLNLSVTPHSQSESY